MSTMVRLLSRYSCYGGLTLLLGLSLWFFHAVLLDSSVPMYSVAHSDDRPSSLSVSGLRSAGSSSSNVHWHIKPIKPLHEGKVVYLTEFSDKDDAVVYKRIFTAPCGNGMLVFNVGPAAEYEPYTYELYEDAYAYSNNGGLCFLYPSYQGIQTSPYPLWTARDKTEQTVKLGDVPNKISTRVAVPPGTKSFNHSDTKYRGGDFLLIRDGNFYNPTYYKHLKAEINSWPEHLKAEDMSILLSEWMATL
jgi:hypothetical protein